MAHGGAEPVQLGHWIVLHFAVPFFLLLSRQVKRRMPILTLVATIVFWAHLVDVFWLVMPAFFPGHLHMHWLDFVAPVALGGLWLARFSGNCPNARFFPGMRRVSRRWCTMAETVSDTTQARHGHEMRDVDISFRGLFSLSSVARYVCAGAGPSYCAARAPLAPSGRLCAALTRVHTARSGAVGRDRQASAPAGLFWQDADHSQPGTLGSIRSF